MLSENVHTSVPRTLAYVGWGREQEVPSDAWWGVIFYSKPSWITFLASLCTKLHEVTFCYFIKDLLFRFVGHHPFKEFTPEKLEKMRVGDSSGVGLGRKLNLAHSNEANLLGLISEKVFQVSSKNNISIRRCFPFVCEMSCVDRFGLFFKHADSVEDVGFGIDAVTENQMKHLIWFVSG